MEDRELIAALKLGTEALNELQAKATAHAPVSISCGAASTPSGDPRQSASELLRDADAALYVAKRLGGGRVCSAGEGRGSRQAELHLEDSRRGPRVESLASATDSLIAVLDSRLADAPALDRLEEVARVYAQVGDFACWFISRITADSERLVDLSAGDNRDHDAGPIRVTSGGKTYTLADFPVTERVVRAGAGSFFVERDNEQADSAERELLVELDFESVLGAMAATPDEVYVVELYGDGNTSTPWKMAAPLRMAVQAGLPPLRPVR